MKRSPTPDTMCVNKVPYSSKKSALDEMNWWIVRAKEEWGTEPKSLPKAYKCPFCGKWHLGNSKKR